MLHNITMIYISTNWLLFILPSTLFLKAHIFLRFGKSPGVVSSSYSYYYFLLSPVAPPLKHPLIRLYPFFGFFEPLVLIACVWVSVLSFGWFSASILSFNSLISSLISVQFRIYPIYWELSLCSILMAIFNGHCFSAFTTSYSHWNCACFVS